MISIKSFEVNYFSENTYLLYDETKEAVLIDCGCLRMEEQKELSDFVTANGLILKRYLCTHLHLDHVFGNEFVFKTYGLTPEAHKADEEKLPSPAEQARAFGVPIKIKEVPVQHYLVNGERIKFGNSELEVLTVPGHSPGGLAFYNAKNGFVIVGDSIFAGSIGRTDLWGGNQDVLLAALQNKILSLPDETIIYPGHGPETRVIDEKLENPYL